MNPVQSAKCKMQSGSGTRQWAVGRKQKRCFIFFAFCLLLPAFFFCVSCARQMPPPGGPPDEIPPRVVATVPGADSVHVGLDTSIRIEFSEAMDHRSVEQALFMAPQWTQEPKFKWRGRELEVRLAEPLQADRTYVMTVGQESADEWRNRMLASYTFGFATGGRLNRGELHGRVLPSNDWTGQRFVWAYDLALGDAPDPGYDRAAYVTQPDETGHFVLSRLGAGEYRVFAFADQNNDRVYSAGDPLAVPPADVVLEDDQRVRLGDLKLAERDTSAPELVAVRTVDRRHVLMRFNEAVRIQRVEIPNLSVLVIYQDPTDSSGVGLVTDVQNSGSEYEVRTEVSDRAGNVGIVDTPVKGDATRDRQAPEVLVLEPQNSAVNVSPAAQIHIMFSDAMQADAVADLWLDSDSTVVPKGRFEWAAPNHLVFAPEFEWTSGDSIRLIGDPNKLVDVGGNALVQPLALSFVVVDTSALGGVRGTTPDPNLVVWLQGLDIDFFYEQALRDTVFVLNDLTPGDYRVFGFLDRDLDGRWTPGMVKPFVPAEPVVTQADTVTVRSRWELKIETLEAKLRWTLPPEGDGP